MRGSEAARTYGRPGEHPRDLQVPCSDCYSLVVTSIRIPWQPSRKFTTREEGTT